MAANVNRPVVGTVKCYSPECTDTASVHQIAKGSRTGEYYTRCPECKCNQSTGRHFQTYIKNNMQARPGHEVQPEPEPGATAKPIGQDEPIGQSQEHAQHIGQNNDDNSRSGWAAVLAVIAAAAMVAGLSTAGVKTK